MTKRSLALAVASVEAPEKATAACVRWLCPALT
jgi:hypothetical protein